MPLITSSIGIYKRRSMIGACLEEKDIVLMKGQPSTDGNYVYVGWGNKPNSKYLVNFASENNCPFIRLEDGFIGYIGHPASNISNSIWSQISRRGLQYYPLSIVKDISGIYYDSNQPSDIESLISSPLSDHEEKESRLVIDRIISEGVTKYNCYPIKDSHTYFPVELKSKLAGSPYILLIDQVIGDLSLRGAQVSDDDVEQLLHDIYLKYPTHKIVVRAHPDTINGRKKGIFSSKVYAQELRDAIFYSEPCHPHSIVRQAAAIFTLSSQIGFEALLLDRKVYCYGLPFYAGWGLTIDSKQCPRRKNLAPSGVTLNQLVYSALVRYSKYYHPVLKRRCNIHEVIDLISAQYQPAPKYKKLFLVGHSLWKRAFIGYFCRHLSETIIFRRNLPKSSSVDDAVIIWGNKFPHVDNVLNRCVNHQYCKDDFQNISNKFNVLRIEDGFIRSPGLGSHLRRPSSIVIDSGGLYFNAQRSNDLRKLLNNHHLSSADLCRGERLRELLITTDANKYNFQKTSEYKSVITHRKKLLVIGQVDDDASTVTGSLNIKTNEELLWSVREDNPNAWIIYKPHPDVVAGNRDGFVGSDCFQSCVDEYVPKVTLAQMYPHISQLHTMTSLSGFEALIRGVEVVTWGQPFYSGWGLTTDKYPSSDRNRNLSLVELITITLITYPIYIDWQSGLYVPPEVTVERFHSQRVSMEYQQSRVTRWNLKLKYLIETLIGKR